MIKLKIYTLILGSLVSIQNVNAQTDASSLAVPETNSSELTESQKKLATQIEDPYPVQPPAKQYPAGIIKLGDSPYFSKNVITLDKSKRTLYLWGQENGELKLISAYPSDFGRKPGDKLVLGDLKTPEGIYFFETTYTKNQLNFNEYGVRAFTMNYPNFFDKQSKKTGSGIWLHSIPPHKTLVRGSRGCVVVRIDAIENLKKFISMKTTPIVIYPEIKYVSSEQKKVQETQILSWLATWKSNWENKNLEGYINYYSKDFKYKKMNFKKWKTYKQGLNEKYQFISVKLDSPVIIKEDDKYVIKFLQTYSSDLISDFGEKTLYIKESPNGLKIVGEIWESVSKDKLIALKNSEEKAIKSN